MNDVEKQLQSLSEELDKQRERADRYEEEAKKQRARADALAVHMFEDHSEFDIRMQELQASEQDRRNKMQQEFLKAQEELSEKLKQAELALQSLDSSLTEKTVKLAELQQMLAGRDLSAETLLKRADEAEQLAKEMRRERDQMRSELGSGISSLRVEADGHKLKLHEMRKLLSDREVVAEDLQRKLDAANKELAESRLETSNLRSETGRIISEIRMEREQTVHEMKQLLSDREVAAENLQGKLDLFTKSLDQARHETSTLRSEMGKQMAEQRSQAESNLEQAQRMLADREAACELVERKLSTSLRELEQSRNETAAIRLQMTGRLAEAHNHLQDQLQASELANQTKLHDQNQELLTQQNLVKERDDDLRRLEQLLEKEREESKATRIHDQHVRRNLDEELSHARMRLMQLTELENNTKQQNDKLNKLLRDSQERAKVGEDFYNKWKDAERSSEILSQHYRRALVGLMALVPLLNLLEGTSKL